MMTICTPMREDENRRGGWRVGPRYERRENMERKTTGQNTEDRTTYSGKEGRGRKEGREREEGEG